jgi:hypothetical protein
MWDYTDHRDPTRISSDELKEAEIDDSVHAACCVMNDQPVGNPKRKV